MVIGAYHGSIASITGTIGVPTSLIAVQTNDIPRTAVKSTMPVVINGTAMKLHSRSPEARR